MPTLALAGFLLAAAPPALAGYDHYWEWHAPPDPVALEACIADMRRIADASADTVVLQHDTCDVGPREICLNGIGEGEHEDFIFPGGTAPTTADPEAAWNPCKTQWKPYDRVVTACLIAARDHFAEDVLEISSDGYWADWSDGASLYESVLGRPARSPLRREDEGEDEETPRGDGALARWGPVAGVAALVLAAGVGIVLLLLRPRELFRIEIRRGAVTFEGAFPRSRRHEIEELLAHVVGSGSATIGARRAADGTWELWRKGALDDAGWQRVRNVLVSLLDLR